MAVGALAVLFAAAFLVIFRVLRAFTLRTNACPCLAQATDQFKYKYELSSCFLIAHNAPTFSYKLTCSCTVDVVQT